MDLWLERRRAPALNPTARVSKRAEMARAAVFPASPAASFATGTNLVVEGRWRAACGSRSGPDRRG